MHGQFEEVGGAGDTGIVIANTLLAAVANDIIWFQHQRRCDGHQIRFDAWLILRGRRHDTRRPDRAVGVERVAVPADAARRFGAAEAEVRARSTGTEAASGNSQAAIRRNPSSHA